MRRWVHAGRSPHEKGVVKMLALLGQTHADRGLAQVQILGRLRHASGFVEFRNYGQQLQINIGHSLSHPGVRGPPNVQQAYHRNACNSRLPFPAGLLQGRLLVKTRLAPVGALHAFPDPERGGLSAGLMEAISPMEWDTERGGGFEPLRSAFRAGIAGRRRRVVLLPRGAQQFRKERFQRIRPDLVTRDGGMKLVGIHHAFK